MSYRAILTSTLAKPLEDVPFDSLESLLETDFNLNAEGSTGLANYFLRYELLFRALVSATTNRVNIMNPKYYIRPKYSE